MFPLLFNLLLIGLWNIIIQPTNNNTRAKLYCFICGFQWFIISGFRSVYWSDTIVYYNSFQSSSVDLYETILKSIFQFPFSNSNTIDEPLYSLSMLLIKNFGGDFRLFLIIVSLFVSACLSYYIYCNSRNPFYSFLLYSTIFFVFFSMSAIRQSIAISLVGFLGFIAIKKRHYITFFVLLILAVQFHKSAIFALPLLLTQYIKFNKRNIILSIIIFILFISLRSKIISLSAPLIGYDGYVNNSYVGSRTLLYLFAYLAIWFMAIINRNRCIHHNEYFDLLFWTFTIGILYCSFSFSNSNAFRISFYFCLSIFFIIPEIIYSLGKWTPLASFLFVLSCLVLFFILTPALSGYSIFTPTCILFSINPV